MYGNVLPAVEGVVAAGVAAEGVGLVTNEINKIAGIGKKKIRKRNKG